MCRDRRDAHPPSCRTTSTCEDEGHTEAASPWRLRLYASVNSSRDRRVLGSRSGRVASARPRSDRRPAAYLRRSARSAASCGMPRRLTPTSADGRAAREPLLGRRSLRRGPPLVIGRVHAWPYSNATSADSTSARRGRGHHLGHPGPLFRAFAFQDRIAR